MRRRVQILMAGLAACAAFGCGSTPPPKAPDPEPPAADEPSGGMQAMSELGVLDENKVRKTFERIWQGPMTDCQRKGHEFVAGATLVKMRVNHQGRVKWAYLAESNLGDRAVEKCMLDVVRATTWPIPEGGEDGLASQELPYVEKAERPPVAWELELVTPTLRTAHGPLAECRRGSDGTFRATVVVNTDGTVKSVGMAVPHENADEAADCLVRVIQGLHFPGTGSWPAKITFEVP